jgi:hypothetical protein
MVLHPEVIFSVKLKKLSKDLEQNRNDLRKIVIDRFIKEKAGRGNQENTSKYRYIVENLSSGNRVYLTRPVPLNKGFDFIIHVENCIFMNGKDNPRHSDIIESLKKKKKTDIKAYGKLLQALEDVFNCEDPDDIYPKYSKYLPPISKNLSPELILKVVKWLFIEQDIRYWNWSGRYMFMDGIRSIG